MATIQAALTWGINSRANSLAYLPLAPHTLDRIKSWFNSFLIRFCWEWGNRRVAIYSWDDKHCFVWRHWRCQRILFPAGFNGIWYFPTIGLEFNLDFILSGSGSAGNAVTGGFPFTARVTIGDIEGVNGYCSQLGSMAYGTSPPLGWNLILISFFLGQVLLGMRSQEGSHLQLGWLLGTLKVSTDTVPSWVQWHMVLPHHWVGI